MLLPLGVLGYLSVQLPTRQSLLLYIGYQWLAVVWSTGEVVSHGNRFTLGMRSRGFPRLEAPLLDCAFGEADEPRIGGSQDLKKLYRTISLDEDSDADTAFYVEMT